MLALPQENPLRMSFDIKRRIFEFTFRHHSSITVPTEIFIPRFQYPHGYRAEVSDGTFEMQYEQQILVYRHSMERDEHTVRVEEVYILAGIPALCYAYSIERHSLRGTA
jgi:Glycoside hydrolase family 5 C-terminal domain